MRKIIFLLLAAAVLFTLTACGNNSGSEELGEDILHEGHDHDHDHDHEHEEIEDPYASSPLAPYLPTDWSNRYVIYEKEGESADVYCKAAYGNGTNNGWLFQIALFDVFPEHLPVAVNLGTYDGKMIVATYPSDVYEFESDEVTAEYRDMFSDVEDILHQLLHALGGSHDHNDPLNTATDKNTPSFPALQDTYVTPEEIGISDTFVGVFRLDTSRWSEESKNELLGKNNHKSFLSIAPDGTAYLRCGNETTEGTVLIYSNTRNIPIDKSQYQLTFDGTTYEGNMLQLVLTIDDMPEYTDIDGMQGTSWTFIHESDDWWTDATFADDIG